MWLVPSTKSELFGVGYTFLEESPDCLFVSGGDFNHLNLNRLSIMSGLKVLVDFPTRGQSIFDNCLTNKESRFNKCYPIISQIKSDHKGVVLPEEIKLKPVRCTYKVHDYREHCKIAFRKMLSDLIGTRSIILLMWIQWVKSYKLLCVT